MKVAPGRGALFQTSAMERTVRWGILGPGRIARTFAAELAELEGARLQAVASRDLGRAQAFAREFGAPSAYESYAALLADPAVDLVYVATPHNHHRAAVEAALAAGKGVLGEKPLGIDAAEVRSMVTCARDARAFLMEALTTPFMPAIRQAVDWTRDGRIGRPGLLQAFFCFDAGDDRTGRHLSPALAGGAVLDLAIYPLALTSLFFGDEPESLTAEVEWAPTGVDRTTLINLRYPGGAVARLTVSIGLAAGSHAQLWGSEGSIELPDFHRAIRAIRRNGAERTEFVQDGPGKMRFEILEAIGCWRAGRTQSAVWSLDSSLRMAQWQDQLLAPHRQES